MDARATGPSVPESDNVIPVSIISGGFNSAPQSSELDGLLSPITDQDDEQSEETSTTHLSQGVMMASQSADSLNRTFSDLKSKSEDSRLRASYDLYNLVATAARGMYQDHQNHLFIFGLTNFQSSLQISFRTTTTM